jgi:Xaa-Pro aminopeptidase
MPQVANERFHMPDYQARITAVRGEMATRGVALLFLPNSSSLEYVTGLRRDVPNPTEDNRPGDWVSGFYLGLTGDPIVLEPRMGSERVERQLSDLPFRCDFRVLGEPDDYSARLAEAVRALRGSSGSIAVGERTWAKTAIDLLRAAPDAELVNAHDFLAPMRMIKDPEELEIMRRNARLTDDVYEVILPQMALGMSEQDIAWVIDRAIIEHGGEGVSFHTHILIGGGGSRREGSIHDTLTPQTLQRGTALAFDFGMIKDGYCSDFGRTVFVGEPPDEHRRVHDLVMTAQASAIEAMRDGAITAEALDDIARSIIAAAGYGERFIHRLGHSTGKDVHEPPFLLKGDDTVLRTGMCFTIEPSVFMDDGSFIRVEDVVAVTPDGGENFNRTDHALRVLDL